MVLKSLVFLGFVWPCMQQKHEEWHNEHVSDQGFHILLHRPFYLLAPFHRAENQTRDNPKQKPHDRIRFL